MDWLQIFAVLLVYTINIGSSRQLYTFEASSNSPSYFRDLLIDGTTVVVGARNAIYRLKIQDMSRIADYTWEPISTTTIMCKSRGGSDTICHNYIRLLLKDHNNVLMVCGTNAMKPKCRKFEQNNNEFKLLGNEMDGLALSPKTPDIQSTAIYASNSIYTGSSVTPSDYLIYKSDGRIRTIDADSRILNKPDFVASFEEGNQVYFVFREPAVEYINCGKRVYSRISRVCKDDTGGSGGLSSWFTSFFKARMNCSLPGEFPFYFDEVQSMSLVANGNFKASSSASEKIFYAVFSTPANSIWGSAVCAYRWSDVEATFQGKFKEQAGADKAWLSVPNIDTPHPHPTRCVNDTKSLPYATQQFNKNHPLMDKAVPMFGGRPIVMETSMERRFTHIAVDFQVEAADGLKYDVLFIGMDDGTVRKAFNKGQGSQIQTITIEDIEVFDGTPVENIKIHKTNNEVSLIVVSSNQIKKFSVSDCSVHTSCGRCVGSQDVYCSWNTEAKKCLNNNNGLQNLVTGKHDQCEDDPSTTTNGGNGLSTATTTVTEMNPITTVAMPTTTCAPCAPCSCPVAPSPDPNQKANSSSGGGKTGGDGDNKNTNMDGDKDNQNVATIPGQMGASTASGNIYSASMMAIATVISIALSLIVGFVVGYQVSKCRKGQDVETPFCDRSAPLRKSQNAMEQPQFVTNDSNSNTHNNKQLNMVVNLKPKSNTNLTNGNAEQKQKVKKVYL